MSESRLAILIFIVFLPVLLIQGWWIFNDARKRGERFYWLWGLYGLLNTPSSLLIYLLVTRVIIDKYIKRKK
ncbi:MAG: hypothetical protein ACOZCL_16715 [Bacillota bacterium]